MVWADPSVWDAFDGRPHSLRMGLHPLPEAAWVRLPGPGELSAELDRKANLLASRRGQVLAAQGGQAGQAGQEVERAGAELAGRLVDHLVMVHPDRYRREGGVIRLIDDGRTWDVEQMSGLELAGRMVSEDWCLVRPGDPPVLAGAVLCSPNRWRLSEKLGRPVTDIHDPVPDYRRRLGPPVDAVLGGRGRPVWRRNWSIQSSPSRFQPYADGPEVPEVPGQVWVRSEYETLIRLPETGWWVFGIHTAVRPLADVAGQPDLARRVETAVATLDPATAAYKDLAGWRPELLAWLHAVAQPGPG